MQADGSAPERLTECTMGSIAWSPDGKMIAFSRRDDPRSGDPGNQGPGDSLCVMGAEAGEVKQLSDAEAARTTSDPAATGVQLSYAPWDRSPSWSPDGTLVAFERYYGDLEGLPDMGVYSANVRTGAVREVNVSHALSVAGLPEHASFSPRWSPDGSLIAFEGLRGEGFQASRHMWTMEPDGRHERELTHFELASDGAFEWSPDGRWIAYAAYLEGGNRVRVVGRTGEGRRTLARVDRWVESISWSPDGRALAIGSYGGALKLVDVASGDARTPVEKLVGCQSPAWSPDGEWLAFEGKADGDAEIWLLNVQTGATTQLTDNSVDDTSPQWEPAGVPAAR